MRRYGPPIAGGAALGVFLFVGAFYLWLCFGGDINDANYAW
jgi:hypothetical protein